ncbi:MAG: hypothetical protein COV76_06530 [Candidatus Omnitrophica bacterium CG11_big_fil_rev_8_21_14_0_20_64_10]|nr:MAG: hypothetical protein COV76_06530 [Candidatus Omnitrophica bacterium CG11_big_fil_rev_8_21_14_0_20_64_10]
MPAVRPRQHPGRDHRVSLRHFPYRSREQIRKKILKCGETRKTDPPPPNRSNLGRHWEEAYRKYQEEGEPYLDRVCRNQSGTPGVRDPLREPGLSDPV